MKLKVSKASLRAPCALEELFAFFPANSTAERSQRLKTLAKDYGSVQDAQTRYQHLVESGQLPVGPNVFEEVQE